MQVTVDQDRCCSSGQCARLAPAVFDQSEDDGVVELLLPRPPEELHGAVRTAAGICPGRAISVQDVQPAREAHRSAFREPLPAAGTRTAEP